MINVNNIKIFNHDYFNNKVLVKLTKIKFNQVSIKRENLIGWEEKLTISRKSQINYFVYLYRFKLNS